MYWFQEMDIGSGLITEQLVYGWNNNYYDGSTQALSIWILEGKYTI